LRRAQRGHTASKEGGENDRIRDDAHAGDGNLATADGFHEAVCPMQSLCHGTRVFVWNGALAAIPARMDDQR
jgi:hypothetical protein